MIEEIDKIEKWFYSLDDTELDIDKNINSLKQLTFSENSKNISLSLNIYMLNIEKYIKRFISGFNFKKYKNYNHFLKSEPYNDGTQMLSWFKHKNFNKLANLILEINSKNYNEYDFNVLYRIFCYYNFLIETTMENENIEGCTNFIIGYVDSINFRIDELIKNKKEK